VLKFEESGPLLVLFDLYVGRCLAVFQVVSSETRVSTSVFPP